MTNNTRRLIHAFGIILVTYSSADHVLKHGAAWALPVIAYGAWLVIRYVRRLRES